MKALFALVCAVGLSAPALALEAGPEPGPGPLPGFGPRAEELTRRIVFKALVDATDDIIIQNGTLRMEHVDWSPSTDISINNKKWKPTWKEDKTEVFKSFRPPLAAFGAEPVKVQLVKGRGEAFVKEQPTVENGGKLIVRVRDSGLGASKFEVRITW